MKVIGFIFGRIRERGVVGGDGGLLLGVYLKLRVFIYKLEFLYMMDRIYI